MNLDLVQFEQTLHGYDNGHRLLASSLALNAKDERALLSMSDLSGPRAMEQFLEYATGYTLPGGTHYVIAKTWYANEMERPGCVWTHSILIPLLSIPEIGDLSAVRRIFFRPKLKSGYRYSDTLAVPKKDFQTATGMDTIPARDLSVICGLQTLFSSEEPLVALLASSGLEFERFCMALWSQLWPHVRTDFSFCTGSLSKRVLNGKPLSLQCGPDRVVRDMKERSVKDCSPARWAEVLLDDLVQPTALRKFLLTNGGERDRLSDVGRVSQLFVALRADLFAVAFNLLRPDDSQKAPTLVESVLAAAESRMAPLDFLARLVDQAQQGGIFNTQFIQTAVKRALTASRSETLDFVAGVLQSLSVRVRNSVVVATATSIDIRELVAIADLHPDLYQAVVTQRPELAYSPELWCSSLPLLEKLEFFEAVQKDRTISKQKLFEAILESRDVDLCSEVVKHLGPAELQGTLKWLVERDANVVLRSQWIAYLRQYQKDVLLWAVEQPATYALALVLANVVDFSEGRGSQLLPDWVLELAAMVDKAPKKRDEVTAFIYVSTSLVADKRAAEYCVKAFANLHTAIAESRLSQRAWEIMECNLMPLPHEQWDACEKLRRAVLHFNLHNRWPIGPLWALMAAQVDLFHSFIRTAKGFEHGKLFFSEVRDAGVRGMLSVTKQQFKEIKKLLR